MSAFARPQAVELTAIEAVRYGRQLAESWPDVAVENTTVLDPLLNATLARFASGEVFSKDDDHPLALMLIAVRQTLDGYRHGYGDFFMRENTGRHPFFDIEQDRVRRLGEVLKGFIEARQAVIDAVLAERQIRNIQRR
jgi:hypothetical protein